MPCRKPTLLRRPGKPSNGKPTTPTASGRFGWCCANANWPRYCASERAVLRRKLRQLTHRLNSYRALEAWLHADDETESRGHL